MSDLDTIPAPGDEFTGLQFTSNNRECLSKDVLYWDTIVRTALSIYGATRADGETELKAKSIAMARLAGIGLAMAEHFAKGLITLRASGILEDEDQEDIFATTNKPIDVAHKHFDRNEERAKASQS